jgi:DNA replication licensing factor MCM2
MMKKYIMYAKERTSPQISEMDKEKVASYYAELRKESLVIDLI